MLRLHRPIETVSRGHLIVARSFGLDVKRSYADAIRDLNSLQANHEIIKNIQQDPDAHNARAMPEMHAWLRRAGYQAVDFNQLNAVHIAGTKGKGSTSAFVSSILAQYLPKVGLYTSPHLRFVRERIQINNEILTEEQFTTAFYQIWNRLDDALQREGAASDGAKPAYFRYLTILAYHTFLELGVDTAVIEVGMGGEYDSTNILQKPTVTGITSLGIDHVKMLGHTIDKIAWHKAGIMKPGSPAYTVPQPPEAMSVLKNVARDRNVHLEVIDLHPEIKLGSARLGLSAPFQKINASLAVKLAAEHLRIAGSADIDTEKLPQKFLDGLRAAHIGGRCETRVDNEAPLTWRIDGAHTAESIKVAADWYASCITQQNQPRILLFNQQTRDAVSLAKLLHETLSATLRTCSPFSHVVFCTNKTYKSSGYRPDLISINHDAAAVSDLSIQRQLEEAWKQFDPNTVVQVAATIEEAIHWCRETASTTMSHSGSVSVNHAEVMVTGSLHLVGGVLDVLEPK